MNSRIFTVCLPDIGEGVVEGEVIEWLKNVGDNLKQDEPVVVVMTDKATVELPAPYPGVLHRQYYRVGEISIKDKPLYDIQFENEVVGSDKESKVEGSDSLILKQSPPAASKSVSNGSSKVTAAEQMVLATPRVRCLAEEVGVDIEQLSGTGKDGRIIEEDIKSYVSSHSRTKHHSSSLLNLKDDEVQPLAGISGFMARKMAEGHTQIPQFSYFEPVDATHLIQMRQKFKAKAAEQGIQLSYMPFFIRALSLTIQQYPMMNCCIDMSQSQILIHKHHNIGVAMASPQGLVVPVLKDVQTKSLEEIIKDYEALKMKSLEGKLSPADMRESTITITNFGAFEGSGVWATPMINFPEVAILGTARIRKEPVVRNDEIVIRDMLSISWSFDHRVIDGKIAISISHYFSKLIRDPAQLLYPERE